MNPRSDERIKDAILWRLWLPPYSTQQASRVEVARAQQDWQAIWSWLSRDQKRIKELAEQMIDPLVEAIEWALTRETKLQKAGPNLPKRWEHLYSFIQQQRELPGMMAHRPKIPEAVFRPLTPAQPSEPGPQTPASPDSGSNPRWNQEGKIIIYLGVAEASPEATNMSSTSEATGSGTNDAGNANSQETSEGAELTVTQTPSLSPQWKWLSLPNEPAEHDESYEEMKDAPGGMKLIGARVRGKKHKHDGTNCDDWFEFAVNGPWTIIVVSDGAGSKKFSRIGARVACEKAAEYLKSQLEDCQLDLRDDLTKDSFLREGDDRRFVDDELQVVQKALHSAMTQAHAEVRARAEYLRNIDEYKAVLGREVEFDDLSGTLLIAVHTTLSIESLKSSFVLTCQIGDGMLGVIDRKGGLQLLGEPDSGEFAGQTDFLTNSKKLEPGALANKTFVWLGQLGSLMVMSDGVADDYYPNDPGLLRLYGDLSLNQIIEHSGPNNEDIAQALAGTALQTPENVISSREDFSVQGVTATNSGQEKVTLLSAAAYAEKLGEPIEQLARSQAWLIAGARAGYLQEKGRPSERLRWWLDTYQVRGSFDDRTLVILHQGKVS